MVEVVKEGRRGRILVVDDQRNMRTTTALLLEGAGLDVHVAAGGEEALEMLGRLSIDVLLTDLKMEPMDGLTLLKRAVEIAPSMQVILMTAHGSLETAVEAMRHGAHDYITKPFKEYELLHRIERALEKSRLQSTVDLFVGEFHQRHGLAALIGNSAPMRELASKIARVAASDASVLISGESGTGKELVARAIHALSPRSNKPFVPINCAAITESLLESELFGHSKGAFTGALRARRGIFEEAHGGTVFIDEVTETTTNFQSKLLRVLQEGEIRRVGESTSFSIDARTVAATNRSIDQEVAAKRFRQDLFYRLAVVTLVVPPLRDRRDDIPVLAQAFLERANARNKHPHRLTPFVVELLMGYSFPGNVRELENLIEQAAALAESEELVPEDFPIRNSPVLRSLAGEAMPSAVKSLDASIAEAERMAITAAISALEGDLLRVAEALDISTTTLWRKMKRLGIAANADAVR